MAAWVEFNNYKEGLLDLDVLGAAINHEDDTIKIMLVDSTLTPTAAGQDFIDDLSANEVSGDGYTAGGNTLGSKTVSEAAGVVTFDSADTTWSQGASGFTDARHAIMYKDTGTPATSPVMYFATFAADKGNDEGDFTIEMDATGISTLT